MTAAPQRGREEPAGPDRAVAIGLTGGQGAGKSLALELFERAGAEVLSADAVVAGLYRRADVLRALRERFGGDVITPDGGLARGSLRAATAGDEGALDWLEGLLHPLVVAEVRGFVDGAAPEGVVVVEVPLLFEARLEGVFDLTVTIEAPRSLRRRRVQGREGAGLFDRLERRQLGSAGRSAAADFVYVNDARPEDMAQFVDRVLREARSRERMPSGRRPGRDGEGHHEESTGA